MNFIGAILRFAAAKIIKNIDMENDIQDAKETDVADSPHSVLSRSFRTDYAWSRAESAIRPKRRRQASDEKGRSCIFAPDMNYYKPKDNGAGRFTNSANGKDPCIFFDRPASVSSKARIRFCHVALRFVGKEPTSKVH